MKIIKLIISLLLSLVMIVVSIASSFATDLAPDGVLLWDNEYFESVLSLKSSMFSEFQEKVESELNGKNVNDSILYYQKFSELEGRFFMYLTDGTITFSQRSGGYLNTIISNFSYYAYVQVTLKTGSSLLDKVSFAQFDIYDNSDNLAITFCPGFELLIAKNINSDDVSYIASGNYSKLSNYMYQSSNIYLDLCSWASDKPKIDVNYVSGNYIKYYSQTDNYKIGLHKDFYGINGGIKNFLNSSISFSDELYYQSNVDNVDVNSDNYQHIEILDFYLKGGDEFQQHFRDKYGLGSSGSDSWLFDKTNENKSYITNYLNSVSTGLHYSKGSIMFSEWFLNAKKDGAVVDDIELVNSRENTDVYYIHWSMYNTYTYTGSSSESSGLFAGYREDTNAKLFNFATGKDIEKNGIGQNVNDADDSNVPSKSDLLYNGWSNGYPNQTGNYPYCLTICRNGTPYLKFFFKSKPSVVSHYYSDNQIRYTFNMKNIAGYVYFVQHNVSKSFDFAEIEQISDTDFDSIFNVVALGLDIASVASESLPLAVISVVVDLCSMLSDLNSDYTVIKDSELIFWTNYTGNKSNYNGWLCQFNWDIGTDKSFVRDNSDDNYNYSSDYVKDSLKTEDGTGSSGDINSNNNYGGNTYNTWNYYYYDNNGNVHGGGDDTYIATEPPTVVNTKLAEYEGYNFDDVLTIDNTNSFFDFIRQALSVLPFWVYASIAASFAVLVILRILKR